MTHEHLGLAMALDVPFFITITKTDLTPPQETINSLETMLKSAGCRKVRKVMRAYENGSYGDRGLLISCLFQVPLVIRNEDDVITAGSNQLLDNIVPIFCVSSVSGEGLQYLTKFLYVLPPGISSKEKERLEQVKLSLCIFKNVLSVTAEKNGLRLNCEVISTHRSKLNPVQPLRFITV